MKTAAKDFKMTELGPIPKDWEVKRLGEIGQFKNGISKGAELFGHGVPFVNLLDVFGKDKIDDVRMLGLVEVTAAEQMQCSLKEGDVLFVRSSVKPSGVGLATVVSCDLPQAVFSGFLLRYRSEGLETEYKRYAFSEQGFRSRVIASSTVSANTNINQGALKGIEVVVPPLPEQRKIAAALSDVDEMIAALEKLIEKKRKIKAGAMQRLLTGKTRLPGFKGAWVEKRFDEFIARFATGLNPRQNFRLNDGGSNFYVTIKDFREGMLYFDECDKVDDIALKMINDRSDLRKGDMLFSSIGRVGDAYVIKETPKNWNVNESVFVLRPDVTMMDVDFMYYLVKSERVQDKLTGGITGSTLTGIKVGHLKEISCEFPSSLAEQKAIAKVLGDMDEEIAALEAELAKTRQLKQGMMQELLTGKVRLV